MPVPIPPMYTRRPGVSLHGEVNSSDPSRVWDFRFPVGRNLIVKVIFALAAALAMLAANADISWKEEKIQRYDEQPVYLDDDSRYILPWGKYKIPDGELQVSQMEWFLLKLLALVVAIGVAVATVSLSWKAYIMQREIVVMGEKYDEVVLTANVIVKILAVIFVTIFILPVWVWMSVVEKASRNGFISLRHLDSDPNDHHLLMDSIPQKVGTFPTDWFPEEHWLKVDSATAGKGNSNDEFYESV